MKQKYQLLLTLAFCLQTLCLSTVFAQSSFYQVTYGAPGTPGRIYDSNSNTTTFTYYVAGVGSHPDDANNLRLKALKISECLPPYDIAEVSPDLPELDQPPFFSGPNPDRVSVSDDPVGFPFDGLLWKGWNNNVLLEVDEARSFSVSYSGDIPESLITVGTAIIDNSTGNFRLDSIALPGAGCTDICTNRVTIDFEHSSSITLAEYLAAFGITANNLTTIDSATPSPNCTDIGTANSAFGGSGFPVFNPATGDGSGNYLDRHRVAVIPSQDNCPAAGGLASFSFQNPAQIVALSFIDLESTGATVTASSDTTTLFTEQVTAAGDNSVQTIPFADLHSEEVTTLDIEFNESAAIDELILCMSTPTPTATPTPTPTATPTPTPTATPTPTTPPQCIEGSIQKEQFDLDGLARRQAASVQKLARRLQKLAKNKRTKRFAKKVIAETNKNYIESWELTWSMNTTYITCQGEVANCSVDSDYSDKTGLILTNSNELLTLANRVLRKLRSARSRTLRKGDIKLFKLGSSLQQETVAVIESIPKNPLSCSGLA